MKALLIASWVALLLFFASMDSILDAAGVLGFLLIGAGILGAMGVAGRAR